jgi:pilus assembly protein CpaE
LLTTLDIPALKNLKITLETLELLNYPRERLRVVLNRADSKVGLSISEVEKTLKVPITGRCRPRVTCRPRSTEACRSCSTTPSTR